jgi:hypothetical protein
MDLSFNVLESIRRDIRELRDDLSSEKSTRSRQIDELTQDVKDIRRHVARDCCALEATIRSPLMLDRRNCGLTVLLLGVPAGMSATFARRSWRSTRLARPASRAFVAISRRRCAARCREPQTLHSLQCEFRSRQYKADPAAFPLLLDHKLRSSTVQLAAVAREGYP